MAHCLQVTEILLHIFEDVYADCVSKPSLNSHQDLASLARTCRLFSGPALALLWRIQASLLPLVMCFPPGLLDLSETCHDDISETSELFESGVVKFTQSPSVQDWERPLVYTKYIEEITSDLSLFCNEQDRIHPSVLQILLHSCPTASLLPNLRNLALPCISACNTGQCISSLFKLSSPTVLQALEVQFPISQSVDDISEFLTRFGMHCATIKTLKADIREDDPMHPSEYFITIGSLQNLTSLVMINRSKHSSVSSTSRTGMFPAILELDLRFFSISAAIQVLKAIHSNNLRKLDFSLDLGPPEVLHQLCEFMASRQPWRQSMRSVTIRGLDLTSRSLDALLSFGHLRQLDIYCSVLDDQRLDEIAQAFPMLERLDLIDEMLSSNSTAATLNCLISFYQHCPHITYIDIRLDACKIPQLDDGHELLPKTDSHRETLYLGIHTSSEIQIPPVVATFILRLFPRTELSLRQPVTLSPQTTRTKLWRRVAGIIEKGQEWISESLLLDLKVETLCIQDGQVG